MPVEIGADVLALLRRTGLGLGPEQGLRRHELDAHARGHAEVARVVGGTGGPALEEEGRELVGDEGIVARRADDEVGPKRRIARQ